MTNIGIEEIEMERIRVGQEEVVSRVASEALLAVEVTVYLEEVLALAARHGVEMTGAIPVA